MKAFITGSHAYGKPTPESDVDVVVFMNQEAKDLLLLLSDTKVKYDEDIIGIKGAKDISKIAPIRFGKLNLVVCYTKRSFKAWKRGTDYLVATYKQTGVPFTKQEAKEVFDRYRAMYCVEDDYIE